MRSVGEVIDKVPSSPKFASKTTINKAAAKATPLAPLSKLDRLNLIRMELTHAGLEGLIELSSPENFFTKRSLRHPRRLWDKLRQRKSAAPTPTDSATVAQLESRRLHEDSLTSEDLELIGQLTDATTLSLNGLGVTDDVLQEIGNLRQLKALDLSCNPEVSDTGIARVGGLSTLAFLSLDELAIGDAAISALNLPKLSCLRCDQTRITNQAASSIAKLSNLTALSVNDTNISDAGVRELVQLEKLERLSLSGTSISDSAGDSLASLSSLAGLALDETKISDGIVPQLSKLTGLAFLSVCDTQITEAGCEQLSQSLPNCDIWI